jgi:hypothetical protein
MGVFVSRFVYYQISTKDVHETESYSAELRKVLGSANSLNLSMTEKY